MMNRQASKASPRCAELTPTQTAMSPKPRRTDAMDAQGMLDRKAAQRLGNDALAFLYREFLKCLVFRAG